MQRAPFSLFAILFAALGLTVLPWAARAQSADELQSRLQRVERDMHDLQAEVYRGSARPRTSAAPAGDDIPPGQAAPLTQRVNDIEEGLRRLTGQVEELSHRLSEISQVQERLQKERDYQGSAQNDFSQVPASPDAPRALAPSSGSLGTLPSAAAPPRPVAAAPAVSEPADPNASFDAAMKLLGRAQYAPARQGFRQYVDANPKGDHAPEALYWSGDIAYSMQKKYEDAARDFAELIKKYPKSAEAPNAMLKLGLSLIALNQKQEGCSALAALPAKYPKAESPLLARAKTESGKAGCT